MRYRIKAVDGPIEGSVFSLDERVTFGRGRGADIQLVSRAASRRHARVRLLSEDQPVLEDLDSVNGTYVNGERIRKSAKLSWKDNFTIGKTTFVFEELSKGEQHDDSIQLLSGNALNATRYDPNDDDMDEETLRMFIPDLAKFRR